MTLNQPNMNKTTAPEIERLKFSDLVINNLYSGRTEKEINENAKEKTKELEAFGGWNPAMPGHYFVGEDGKKHLLAGFSRVKASQINGEKEGYFVEVKGDEIDHLLACETSNSVRPLSTLARGARYASLQDGELSDDFAEAIADPKNPEHWKRMPLSQSEIAARIGKTPQWVQKCIAIFEAPPEIRDMLESEKIAVTVVEGAKSLVNKYHNGSEAKQIAICKKAFAAARSEGKESATKKHFESIRNEFIPEKKLVADGGGKEKPEKEDELPLGDASSAPQELVSQESKADTAETAQEPTTGNLDSAIAGLFDAQSETGSSLKARWKSILMNPENLEDITLDEGTADSIVEMLHAEMESALNPL